MDDYRRITDEIDGANLVVKQVTKTLLIGQSLILTAFSFFYWNVETHTICRAAPNIYHPLNPGQLTPDAVGVSDNFDKLIRLYMLYFLLQMTLNLIKLY